MRDIFFFGAFQQSAALGRLQQRAEESGKVGVAGASAGSEPDDSILNKVYEVAKPRNVPVFCNTGCRHENVREKLKYCDAVCMGTAFKKDGVFNGRVDEERVRSFMEIVYDIRARL